MRLDLHALSLSAFLAECLLFEQWFSWLWTQLRGGVLLIILEWWFERLFLLSWTVMCHIFLLVALEASSSGFVVLLFSFSVCMSDLCKMGRIHILWNYLIIRMGALLLVLWLGLLCTSYPLEFDRFRMFDCLAMLIFLDLCVGNSNVFVYGGWLLVSMKNSILEVVFYAHYKELNCCRVCKVELCLFGKMFECCDIVIKVILLHVQVVKCAHSVLLLSNVGEIGIKGSYKVRP